MAFRLIQYCALLCLASACVNDPAELAEFDLAVSEDVEIAQDVTIRYSDSARVRVIIEAPTMFNYLDPANPYQEFPDGLLVTFYDQREDTSSVLSAKKGTFSQRSGEVVVRDSVVWESVSDEMLETEELIWDQRDALIHTNKFVVITQPGARLYGYGFEAPQDFSTARIKQITGRVPLNRPRDQNP